MPIETKRWNGLPWWVPGNTRPAQTGEVKILWDEKVEGYFMWQITVLSPDLVSTTHQRPYSINSDGTMDYLTRQITHGQASKEEINGFGPSKPPWRWRP